MTTSADLSNEEFREMLRTQFREDIGPVNDATRIAYELYFARLADRKERRHSLKTRTQSTTSQPGHRTVEDLSRRSTLSMLPPGLRKLSDTSQHSFTRRTASFARSSSPQTRRFSGGIRRDVSGVTVIPIFSERGHRAKRDSSGESLRDYFESLNPVQIAMGLIIVLLVVWIIFSLGN